MAMLSGGFTVASWNEEAYEEREGRRLTRASVTQRFDGDIAGEGAAEWLMAYVNDPRSVRPNSRMPSFAGKINEQDLRALAAFLASLK